MDTSSASLVSSGSSTTNYNGQDESLKVGKLKFAPERVYQPIEIFWFAPLAEVLTITVISTQFPFDTFSITSTTPMLPSKGQVGYLHDYDSNQNLDLRLPWIVFLTLRLRRGLWLRLPEYRRGEGPQQQVRGLLDRVLSLLHLRLNLDQVTQSRAQCEWELCPFSSVASPLQLLQARVRALKGGTNQSIGISIILLRSLQLVLALVLLSVRSSGACLTATLRLIPQIMQSKSTLLGPEEANPSHKRI